MPGLVAAVVGVVLLAAMSPPVHAIARPTVLVAVVALAGWVLLATRRPGHLPAGLLLVASLTPYPLSFVGKTPLGVVSVTGALALLAFAAFLLHRMRIGHVPLGRPEVVAGLLWASVLVLSSVTSADPRLTLNRTRLVVVAVLAAYVVGLLIATLDARAADRVVPVLGVLAVLAVLERVAGVSPYEWVTTSGYPLDEPPPAERFESTRVRLGYYHASTLGTVLAAGFGLVLVRVRSLRHPMAVVIVPLLVVAIYLTLTFQAWVATCVALLVLAAGMQRMRVGLAAVGIAAGVVLATGAVGPVNDLIDRRLNATGTDQDQVEYRLALWPAAFERAADAPLLGTGPGTFNFVGVRAVIDNRLVQLVNDNTFTAALVETGYLGLLTLVAFLALVARALWRQPVAWRRWVGLSALSAWLTMSMSVDHFFGDQALLPVWLLLGLLAAPTRQRQAAPGAPLGVERSVTS